MLSFGRLIGSDKINDRGFMILIVHIRVVRYFFLPPTRHAEACVHLIGIIIRATDAIGQLRKPNLTW